MPVSPSPLLYRLYRAAGWNDLDATATTCNVLHEAQIRYAPAAITLPDETDRIISHATQSSAPLERARLAEGEHSHGPTIVRTYANATLLDGTIYTKTSMLDITGSRRRIVHVPRWNYVDEALLCSNSVIHRYFGHWITDGLPLEMLAGDLGISAVTPAKERWYHEPEYRRLVELVDHPIAAARISNLSIADDRGLNDHWIGRIQRLRSRIASASTSASTRSQPVFIRRGGPQLGRTLTNEEALTHELERRGFVVLAPERNDAGSVADVLRQASLIIAVEGSAQAHAVLSAAPETPFVTIMPPRQFNSVFKPICDALGFPWAFTVADDRGNDSFEQPLDRLLRLVDKLS